MSETVPTHESWIAGLIEHRIALGMAATASILLMVLLVIQPGGESDHPTQGTSKELTVPEKQANTARQASPEQAKSSAPRYRIPEKASSPPKPEVIRPARIIRPITPSTPSQPARIRQPSPAASPPAPAKSAAPAKANPSSRTAGASIAKPATATQGSKASAAQVFFVQVAAYRDRNSAQQQAAMLMQKGWNSTVTANAKGWYTVRIGPVSSRGAADKLRQQLRNKAKLKGFVVQG